MNKSISTLVTALLVMAGAAAIGSSAAQAAAPSTQQLTCDGQQLTLRTNNNNSSDMGGWSSAQVVAGGTGHLIPVSFDFSAYDNTTEQQIFDGLSIKGAGNANRNQQPKVTCVQQQTATLSDLLQPGDSVPPGASLTDTVTVSLTVVAYAQK